MRTAAMRSMADFRTWQFIFAHILFHEIAHVFVTFLGNTNPGTLTPPTIGCGLPGVYSDGIIRGEAGRWLEYVVFGGTVELVWDPDRQDDQAVCISVRPWQHQLNSLDLGRDTSNPLARQRLCDLEKNISCCDRPHPELW